MTEQMQTEQRLRRHTETLEDQVRLRTAMIQMLHDIASHVHEAVTLDEAVQFVLCLVADYNGWSFGHAFLVRAGTPVRLVPMLAHYEEPGDVFREFRELTGQTILRSGEGLAGRALETGEPVWASELPRDLRPGRAGVIDRLPIESAAAFPVTVGDKVELVLEFFCTRPIEDDERIRQGMSSVAVHLARTIERLRAEAALRESEKRFRELAESVNQVFWILDPATDQMLYISPEWSRILGAPPSPVNGDVEQWRSHLHPDDRERVDEEFRAKARLGLFDVVYRVIRSDGAVRWVHDAAIPVNDLAGNVRRIIGVAEDITERRELEREIADVATREQQRLSRDLHDSIGQELTGLTMMAARHARALAGSSPAEAEVAASLVDGLKRTLQQVRRISRGLAPVDIESGGLIVALAQLAEQTGLAATAECAFRCDQAIRLSDPSVATHLYQIAQEAVANAVKHADAARIEIKLGTVDGYCELTVKDNGRGIPHTTESVPAGMGMRIMRYRAKLIGAKFTIETPARGGTRVVCRVQCHARV
jgi:two-component system, LuxR family, sensor kinase FixL